MSTAKSPSERKSKALTILACILLIAALNSCSSYHTLPTVKSGMNPDFDKVKPGKLLKIVLQNGEKITRMRVQSVDAEKITGEYSIFVNTEMVRTRRTILLSDIKSIKIRKVSAGPTIALVASIGVLLGIGYENFQFHPTY